MINIILTCIFTAILIYVNLIYGAIFFITVIVGLLGLVMIITSIWYVYE